MLATATTGFNQLLSALSTAIFNPVLKLMFAIAFIVFIWGVIQYIRGADSEDARELGTRHMLWGVVGLAIMVGAQGLVVLIEKTVNSL